MLSKPKIHITSLNFDLPRPLAHVTVATGAGELSGGRCDKKIVSGGGVQKTPKYVYRLRWTHATRNRIIIEYDTTRLVYLAFPVLTGLLPSRVPSPGFLFLVCGPCG